MFNSIFWADSSISGSRLFLPENEDNDTTDLFSYYLARKFG